MSQSRWMVGLKWIGVAAGTLAAFTVGVSMGQAGSRAVDIELSPGVSLNGASVPATVRTFPIDERLETKFGSIRVQSRVADLFPRWALRGTFDRMNRAERMRVLRQHAIEKDAPILESAADRSLFHPVTAIAAALQRFFGGSAFTSMPPPFALPRKFERPLTIQIATTVAELSAGNSVEPNVDRNGYYNRETHTLGIVLDPNMLDYYFGASQSSDWNETAEAWVVLKRTALKPLYHELSHALQVEGAASWSWNPVLAEGQAEYLSDLLEREEILGPFFAYELLKRMQAAKTTAEQEALVQETNSYLASERQGRVLQPFEYARVGRLLRAGAGRPQVVDLLVQSYDRFALQSSQMAYDMSWAFFQFVLAQPDRVDDAQKIVDIVRGLQIESARPTIAHMEHRMFLNMRALSAGGRKTGVVDSLPTAVQQHDAHRLRGENWKAYLAIARLLADTPEEPVIWAYLGDVFLAAGQRDLFFIYYDRAMKERHTGDQMGGAARIINRYVDALWSIGQIQHALDAQREYTITPLDLTAVMQMTLRRDFAIRAQEAKWRSDVVQRLTVEFELGRVLIDLSALVHSRTIAAAMDGDGYDVEFAATKALGLDGIRQRANRLVFQLGYPQGRIPADAWFIQDFQLIDGRLDIASLCLRGANGCTGTTAVARDEELPGAREPLRPEESSLSVSDWFQRAQMSANPNDKIEAYTHTLAARPMHLPSLINRCLAYRDVGNYAAATKDCSRAVELAPNSPTALNNLGWVYQGTDEFAKAIEHYTRAIAIDAGYRRAWENRADCYIAMGDLTKARQDREHVVRLAPDDADALNDLAWLLIDRRLDVDVGIRLAKQAATLAPDNANALDTLGWGFFSRGDVAAALPLLEKANRLKPGDQEIQRHLKAVRDAKVTAK